MAAAADSEQKSWPQVFDELKQIHNDAFFTIDKGIKLEEEGQNNQAVMMYEEGLKLIDNALALPIICPADPDFTWESSTVMLDKMRRTRKEVMSRMADLQSERAAPPSYEEATSLPRTYQELGDALQELKVETGASTAEILYTHDNVQLYMILPNGTVTCAPHPDTLTIAELTDETDTTAPRHYLQVGAWVYPLVPGVSPCFRSEYGALILPDVHSPVDGAAVGLVLPPEASEDVLKLLEDILCGIVSREVLIEKRAGRQRRADMDGPGRFSQGIVHGAQYISHGLVRGAEKAGGLLNYVTPKIMERLKQEPSPRPVDPRVSKGIHVVRNVTGTAVQVTGYVASAIGSGTMALGRFLAPHIQRQGTRLLSSTFSLSEQDASDRVKGALQVAAGAVEGFGTVYQGLETSAGILGSSLANNTVLIVQHKYGQPVGEVTGDTLQAVGNVFSAGNNLRGLTAKGLVKTAGKQAGKGIVEEYREALRKQNIDQL